MRSRYVMVAVAVIVAAAAQASTAAKSSPLVGRWQAKVKVPLGLGGLKMTVDFEKMEERKPEFASLNAKGKGVGAMMNMTTEFRLRADGERTTMDWTADVKIAGPDGSMGQRVLQPIINQQVGNVLTALEAQVQKAKAG